MGSPPNLGQGGIPWSGLLKAVEEFPIMIMESTTPVHELQIVEWKFSTTCLPLLEGEVLMFGVTPLRWAEQNLG